MFSFNACSWNPTRPYSIIRNKYFIWRYGTKLSYYVPLYQLIVLAGNKCAFCKLIKQLIDEFKLVARWNWWSLSHWMAECPSLRLWATAIETCFFLIELTPKGLLWYDQYILRYQVLNYHYRKPIVGILGGSKKVLIPYVLVHTYKIISLIGPPCCDFILDKNTKELSHKKRPKVMNVALIRVKHKKDIHITEKPNNNIKKINLHFIFHS